MSDKVCVITAGKAEVHLPDATGNYATLCGLDGNDDDPAVDQRSMRTNAGAKINCQSCIAIWKIARSYRPREFDFSGSPEVDGGEA